jgi:hypothetical protein
MVMLPVDEIVDVVAIDPDVLMIVDPPMRDAPCTVPPLKMVVSRVLLRSVSVASWTTIVPLEGKTAVELIPVPPIVFARVPATAAVLLRSTVPKVGTLLEITST